MTKKHVVLTAVALAVTAALYLRFAGQGSNGAAAVDSAAAPVFEKRPGHVATGQRAAVLRGRLVDRAGQPLEGHVSIAPHPGLLIQTRATGTSPDGSFEHLDVAPGAYLVTGTSRGYLPSTVQVSLESSAYRELTLVLEPGGARLFGVVQDVESGGLEGALVLARPLTMHDLDGGPAFAAVTTGDGGYELFVPPGRYQLSTSFDGYAPDERRTAVAEPSRREDVRLYPAGAIEGRVVGRADGQPRTQLLVISEKEGASRHTGTAVTYSDDKGNFVLSGLRPGALVLTARGPREGTIAGTSVVVGIGETVTGVVLYTDDAYRIAGRVISSRTAKPVPGVWVAATASAGAAHARARSATDAQGHFELEGLVPARYMVYTEPGAAAAAIASIAVEVEDRDLEVEVSLDTGLSIRGRVEPAAAATLTLIADTGAMRIDQLGTALSAEVRATATADSSGNFVIEEVPPGDWELVAHTETARGSAKLELRDRDLADVVIAMSEPARLCGRVVDEEGAPVVDARVVLEPRRPPAGPLEGSLRQLRLIAGRSGYPADETGRFCSDQLPPGDYFAFARDRTGMLMPTARQTDGGNLRAIELRGGLFDGYVLEVQAPTGSISGRVVDASGHPMPDVYVRAERNVTSTGSDLFPAASMSGPELPVITDHDGRFEVRRLKPGPYELLVDAPKTGAHGRYDSAFPGSNVTITLEAYGTIRGRAPGARGACAIVLDGRQRRTTQGVGPDCTFELTRLPAGQYTIAAATPDGTATTSAIVRAGQPTDVALSFQAWASIQGQLVDADGAPLAGYPVLASGDGIEDAELSARLALGTIDRTASDGSFHVERISPGRVYLAILPPRAGIEPLVSKMLRLAAGQRRDIGELQANVTHSASPDR